MNHTATQEHTTNIALTPSRRVAKKVCLSCGTEDMKKGRRYCSKECKQKINWVLALSIGLLRTLNARYAAFSFTDEMVILDVYPSWSKDISRFVYERKNGQKPAEGLKCLVVQWGREWHRMVGNRKSKSHASLTLINKTNQKDIDPEGVKPNKRVRPKLSRTEASSLKVLKLSRNDLSSQSSSKKIKSAYKKMAKIHHPDVGGDEEDFKELQNAHEQMLNWAETPRYTFRKALDGWWSYDGYTGRWSPPL
jgi:hypothetical protein